MITPAEIIFDLLDTEEMRPAKWLLSGHDWFEILGTLADFNAMMGLPPIAWDDDFLRAARMDGGRQ